jgi:Kyakuja-Dileera-Zisupton transposase
VYYSFNGTHVMSLTSSFRQVNMDYSLCKALSYNMEDIPVALVMYDIMCQYSVNFQERVDKSSELTLPDSLELRIGIGLFHIHGHQDSCLPRYSPSYIRGAKQVDGEIIETLWAPLNNVSRRAHVAQTVRSRRKSPSAFRSYLSGKPMWAHFRYMFDMYVWTHDRILRRIVHGPNVTYK